MKKKQMKGGKTKGEERKIERRQKSRPGIK